MPVPFSPHGLTMNSSRKEVQKCLEHLFYDLKSDIEKGSTEEVIRRIESTPTQGLIRDPARYLVIRIAVNESDRNQSDEKRLISAVRLAVERCHKCKISFGNLLRDNNEFSDHDVRTLDGLRITFQNFKWCDAKQLPFDKTYNIDHMMHAVLMHRFDLAAETFVLAGKESREKMLVELGSGLITSS
ncbi:MAG: hypothetical protein K8F30_04240 [Taibaiella sp.]|nr:hypothetical protein [Taibaiella sp.]